MSFLIYPHRPVPGQSISAEQLNDTFDAIQDVVNGNLSDENLNFNPTAVLRISSNNMHIVRTLFPVTYHYSSINLIGSDDPAAPPLPLLVDATDTVIGRVGTPVPVDVLHSAVWFNLPVTGTGVVNPTVNGKRFTIKLFLGATNVLPACLVGEAAVGNNIVVDINNSTDSSVLRRNPDGLTYYCQQRQVQQFTWLNNEMVTVKIRQESVAPTPASNIKILELHVTLWCAARILTDTGLNG